ncbi:hypothetical protein GOBAR_DD34044 [Gossypium barbadense]|nr:hypothetical protein GOBAR_DD34044 [Gossypium barbadense]
MGNAVSCAPSIISGGGAVKVVFPNGNIQMYTKSVKAADPMVENPGQFVCDSGGLKVGFRVHGLTADEELERRRLYFLLPMELLYSVLTEEEMSCLSFPPQNAVNDGAKDSVVVRFSKQRSWKPALETIVES